MEKLTSAFDSDLLSTPPQDIKRYPVDASIDITVNVGNSSATIPYQDGWKTEPPTKPGMYWAEWSDNSGAEWVEYNGAYFTVSGNYIEPPEFSRWLGPIWLTWKT